VLVDAPCSSTGVLRRRPSLRWLLNEQEVSPPNPHPAAGRADGENSWVGSYQRGTMMMTIIIILS
jgi:hypothetical protein